MHLKNITYKLFLLYWPIVMLNYILLMGTNINLTVFLVDIPLVLFVLKSFSILVKNIRVPVIFLLCIFSLYVLLSSVAYLINGTPFICFILGVQYYFVPLCFAALGYSFSSDDKYTKSYLVACTVCFIIGFFLYATLPSFYMEYLAEVQGYENFSQDELLGMTRFSSFLPSSYNISYLSVPALIYSLSFSFNPQTGLNRWWCYLFAIISFIAAILCQQRIAMFFAIFVVVFYALYFLKQGNVKFILVCIIAFIIFSVIIKYLISEMDLFDALKENILDRFKKMNLSVAMSSRTEQYSSFNRATWWSYLVGLGVGSCGHLVIPYNLQAIYDGEFVKTFYEFGLVGTTIFGVLILMTLLRGIRLFKWIHAELLCMLFFLGACLGASALTFFIYSSMYWFVIGRIWNNEYLAFRKQNN